MDNISYLFIIEAAIAVLLAFFVTAGLLTSLARRAWNRRR
jgi:hypothetical protein